MGWQEACNEIVAVQSTKMAEIKRHFLDVIICISIVLKQGSHIRSVDMMKEPKVILLYKFLYYLANI